VDGGGGAAAVGGKEAYKKRDDPLLPDFMVLPENEESAARKRKREHGPSSRSSSSSGTAKGWAASPWRAQEYSKDPGIALHQEVNDFVKYIDPTPEERFMRDQVVEKLTALIKGLWPQATVKLFGSVAANLFLPTSDIDMVAFGNWAKPPLKTLAQALRNAGMVGVEVIASAKVPIIKLTEAVSSIHVDISFNMDNGPQEADRILNYMIAFPPLRPLTLVIKQFLAQRGMNEVYTGGLGSYAVLLMTMNFLQQHPVPPTKDSNLGVLLIEFFELYGVNFNWEVTGISIRDGGYYFPKYSRRSMDRGRMMSWYNPNRAHLLSIENPRETSADLCRGSYATDSIRRAFGHAFRVLTSSFWNGGDLEGGRRDHKTLLSRIIKLPQEVVEFRTWVSAHWQVNAEGSDDDDDGSDDESDDDDGSDDNDDDDDGRGNGSGTEGSDAGDGGGASNSASDDGSSSDGDNGADDSDEDDENDGTAAADANTNDGDGAASAAAKLAASSSDPLGLNGGRVSVPGAVSYKNKKTQNGAGFYAGSATPKAASRFTGVVDGTVGDFGPVSMHQNSQFSVLTVKQLRKHEADVRMGRMGKPFGLDSDYTPFGRKPDGSLYAPYGISRKDGKPCGPDKKARKKLKRKAEKEVLKAEHARNKKLSKKAKRDKEAAPAGSQKKTQKEKKHDRKVKMALQEAERAAKKQHRQEQAKLAVQAAEKKKMAAANSPGGAASQARRRANEQQQAAAAQERRKNAPKKLSKKELGKLKVAEDKKVMKLKRQLNKKFRASGMTKKAVKVAVKDQLRKSRGQQPLAANHFLKTRAASGGGQPASKKRRKGSGK